MFGPLARPLARTPVGAVRFAVSHPCIAIEGRPREDGRPSSLRQQDRGPRPQHDLSSPAGFAISPAQSVLVVGHLAARKRVCIGSRQLDPGHRRRRSGLSAKLKGPPVNLDMTPPHRAIPSVLLTPSPSSRRKNLSGQRFSPSPCGRIPRETKSPPSKVLHDVPARASAGSAPSLAGLCWRHRGELADTGSRPPAL